MSKGKPVDPKVKSLSEQSSLNPRSEQVTDPLFGQDEFFDARDLVQVKYEMVRRVRVDHQSVTEAAGNFGFSRPAYYQAQTAFEQKGIVGLVPKKRGPRRRHKLTEEVVKHLEGLLAEEGALSPSELAQRLKDHFGLKVHPRSIERALAGRKKKPR